MARVSAERDPGERDPGDGDGFALVPDAWHPSHVPARLQAIADADPAIANRELDEARRILSKKNLAADVEAVRAAFWIGAPLGVRVVVLMAAGFDKKRAHDALSSFDAFERGRVYLAIDKLQDDLLRLSKCMQGGKIPQKSARGLH